MALNLTFVNGSNPPINATNLNDIVAAINAASNITVTGVLTVSGWTDNSQTITVSGVTTTNTVIVSPAPLSQTAYSSAGIICTSQSSNSLTFICDTTPETSITVNILIIG